MVAEPGEEALRLLVLPLLPGLVGHLARTLGQVLGTSKGHQRLRHLSPQLDPRLLIGWDGHMGTHLPSLPLDLGGLGNRIPALVDVELLGEDFVVEVGILIKELEEEGEGGGSAGGPHT